jgi:hypothetical protein
MAEELTDDDPFRNQRHLRRSVGKHSQFFVRKPLTERLGRFIDRRGPQECWPWGGATVPGGYGSVKVRGRRTVAHRIAYETWVGPIPDGMILLHSCDNPPCCNPAHLTPGTDKGNSLDADAKGRLVRGERAYNAKLTDESVRQLRIMAAAGASMGNLAREYGVSSRAIWSAVNRITWRHVQ